MPASVSAQAQANNMWWLKLAGAFKKFWPQIAIAGAAVAVLTYVYNLGGDNREAAITAELNKQFTKQLEAQTTEAENRHRLALAIQEADADATIASIRADLELEQAKKRQVKYVDKIIIDPNCKRLALDVIGLLQQPSIADD